MIPYLLAVLGGYLIGGSRKEYKKGGKVASSKTESFRDGGEVKELWYVTDERGSVKNLSTTKQKAEVFLKTALKYSGDIYYVKVPLRDWEDEKVNAGNIKQYAKMWSKYTDGGMPSFYPDLEKRAKRAYDYLYKTGSQHMYPELKGDWEEDKDFWIEEYLDRMEKRDD